MTKGGFWTDPSQLAYQPKAQFRFYVAIDGFAFEDAPGSSGASNRGDSFNDDRTDGTIGWYAKSVDKPGLEILSNVGEGDYFETGKANSLIDFDTSKYRMKKITMTLVDPTYPNVTRKLLRWIRRTGYNDVQASEAIKALNLTAGESLLKTIGHVNIYQLGFIPKEQDPITEEDIILNELSEPRGTKTKILEKWTLHNAYPSRIDFGKLDYSSNDLVEIQIDWVYSNFTCDMAKIPADVTDVEQAFPYFKDFAKFGQEDVSKSPPIAKNDCQARFRKEGNGHDSLLSWQYGLPSDDPCHEQSPPRLKDTPVQTEENTQPSS